MRRARLTARHNVIPITASAITPFPEDFVRDPHCHSSSVTVARPAATAFALMADGVERVTGRPAMSVREFVSLHADEFGGTRT